MKINALSKTYEGRRVLSTPAFELRGGEICVLVGANGSGKSSLAKIIAGVISDDKGAKPVNEKLNVGYMPQKSYAFRMSTLRNLTLAGGNEAAAMEMLEKLGIDHLAKAPAKKLSGGESARMALGRVMMEKHELLILDEPTASMDMESTALSEALIMDYCKKSGAAILWVTHSLAQARRVADKAMFLRKGEMMEFGLAEKVLNSPEKEETREFLKFYE